MKTYTIAIYQEKLLACVPDGTDLKPYIVNMSQHWETPVNVAELRTESGLTLTDEVTDEEFPAWDLRWSTAGANLEDESGRVFMYAVRRA